MSKYIQVADGENEDAMEVPLEEDGTLLLSTLNAQFPDSCGLKYRNPISGVLRGIRLSNSRLYPPDNDWENRVYIVVFQKDGGRKREEHTESLSSVELCYKRDRAHRCSDLIVLGLPWKSVEEDLKKYFWQFGELLMVQVKKDPKTSHSKGFGFIRFADYESQIKCLSQRHHIDGRWCDVRIPNSKVEIKDSLMNRKVFVGRCTEEMTSEDLRLHFNKFGEVVDVFIPRPFRAFAFVTFSDPDVAQSLCGEDHIIKGASVHISNASPKSYDKQMDRKSLNVSQQGYGQGGYGHTPWSQGSTRATSQPHLQAQVPSGVPSNMGMGLGPFALNPAMLAAAQAMLSGHGGWGPVGPVNHQAGPQVSVATALPPPVTSGVEVPQSQQSQLQQSFGNIGSGPHGIGNIVSAGNSFLGWGANQGAEVQPHGQSTSPGVGNWGAAPPKQSGNTWS